MGFFKKFFLGSIALSFILLGGSGTQSSNMLLQGGGFIGLIIGLVALYLFTKMAWKAMGCLPSFLVVTGILCFIIYAIGGFKNGLGGVIENLKVFIGHQSTVSSAQLSPQKAEKDNVPNINEGFSDVTPQAQQVQQVQQAQQPTIPPQQPVQPQSQGGLSGLLNTIANTITAQPQQPKRLNMDNLPTFSSQASVVSADTLNIQGHKVKLYGVAGPEITQTCANYQGSSYNCGQQAALWLSNWITDNPVTCKMIRGYSDGSMVAACSLGEYDLGAALINAGWCLADPKEGNIYIPYEENARSKKVGLWQGKFYKPWDWTALKKRKPQYKVIKPKDKNRKSFFL